MKALKALLVIIGLIVSFAIIFSGCNPEQPPVPEPDPAEPAPLTEQEKLDSLTPYTGVWHFTTTRYIQTAWTESYDTVYHTGEVTISDLNYLRLRVQYDSVYSFICTPEYTGELGTCYNIYAHITPTTISWIRAKHGQGTPCSNGTLQDETRVLGVR